MVSDIVLTAEKVVSVDVEKPFSGQVDEKVHAHGLKLKQKTTTTTKLVHNRQGGLCGEAISLDKSTRKRTYLYMCLRNKTKIPNPVHNRQGGLCGPREALLDKSTRKRRYTYMD